MPNGFEFVRCNSVDTVVCPPGSSTVIFSPYDFDGVGPIREFATTNKYVFLRNAGRKTRNLFAGDEFQEVDASRHYYFIISTGDYSKIGPLTQAEFTNHQVVRSTGSLNWKSPVNPVRYFVLAVLGSCLSIPAILIAIIIWRLRKSRHMIAATGTK